MAHLSRVLAAVDFSSPARGGFDYALALAQRHAAELVVIQAVPPEQAFNREGRQREALKASLEQAAAEAAVDFEYRVQHGDAAEIILLHAHALRPDVVVVGSHQRRWRLGSVSQRVVAKASVPVLVVPARLPVPATSQKGDHVIPRTIVSVLDASTVVQVGALTWALSLARWYEADLHVVHVRPSRRASSVADRAGRDALVGQIRRIVEASAIEGVTVLPTVLSGPPVRAVAEYSRQVDAGLVVVTSRPRRRSGYWFHGSFAAALGKAVAVPTLVLPKGLPPPSGSTIPFAQVVSAVDFSEASLLGLSAALHLARRGGGRLKLVHVATGLPYEGDAGVTASRLRPRWGAGVARIKRDLRRLIPPDAANMVDIETTTAAGEAREGILAAASRARADVIVVGLPRRSRFEEFVAGTTVHGVLRRATSPVLLVPGPRTPPRVSFAQGRGATPGLYARP